MGSSPAEIVSTNPASPDDVVLRVAPAGGIDVDREVAAAAAFAREWGRTPAQVRADSLMRVAARVEAQSAELAELCRREVGKPIVEARGEVARTAAIFRYHAAACLDPDGETYPSTDGRSLVMARRRPRGVIGIITPWNFPLAIPAWKLAPALAYGNVCVWKPSSLSPACAQALHRLLVAELPEGVIRLVLGYGDAGAALTGHGGVAAVSFTGSAATGALVATALASRGAGAQCEMGGQNASVVLADADIEAAAATIAIAAMGYAGQKCTATSRVVCERAVAGEMRDAVIAAIERMPLEDPSSDACQVGPVISSDARHDALEAVGRARSGGAQVLTGGSGGDGEGWYLQPTLVQVEDFGSELAQEEVFAPVCAFLEVDSAEQAAAVAAGVRYGLVSSVFTRDLDRALEFAGLLETGLVRVNLPTSGVDFHAPFGGEKDSSVGPREQGKAAREFYTSWRTISIAPSR